MTRILIVDDDADLVDYLTGVMKRSGWEAGIAYDGVEAVLKVMDGGWDAVLMDIRMPTLDGLHAFSIMLQCNRHLPVVLFTGQAGQGEYSEPLCQDTKWTELRCMSFLKR
jgi:two-component system, OmpR family, response regulator